MRPATMAATRSRSREGREAMMFMRPRVRMVPSTQATCPWGRLRTISRLELAGRKTSPLSASLIISITSGGRWDMFPSVSCFTLPPSR